MQWKLERRKLSSLKKYAHNPRILSKHDGNHLRQSLEKFGQCEPIVINADGTIIGGHQRVRTMKSLKESMVDVYVPERALDDQEVRELNIRLNRNIGEWDFDILANEWDENDLLSWGFLDGELGLDVEEVDSSDEEDDDELTPVPDPITKPGDLYILGDHRLLCGDSTNPDDVQKLLGGAEPILMVTDPPYGVNYDASWREVAKSGDNLAIGKVQNDDKINWSLAWSLFPGNAAYVWHAAWFCSEVQQSLEEAEFKIICQIIWKKQSFPMSRGDYHWQHEPCWYAVRKGQKHNWQGSRKESTIWEINNLHPFGKAKDEYDRTNHSTQKPLECMRRPILNNSSNGEGVYDPFVGSGTTLIACEDLKRKSYCMEIDPGYCDIIVERWKKNRQRANKSAEVIVNGQRRQA